MTEFHAELSFALGGSAELRTEPEHCVQTAVASQSEILGANLCVMNSSIAFVHEHQDVALKLIGCSDNRLH